MDCRKLFRDGEHSGHLRGVRMFVALEHLEFGQQLRAEPVFRDHAFNGMFDEPFGLLGADLRDGGVFLAAFPAGIGHELLVRFFFAGDTDFFRVDDNDEIAGVEMRRINGFVFATQYVGNLRGQTTEHRAIGINDVPLALVQIHFRQIRFHFKTKQMKGESIKPAGEVNRAFQPPR